MSRRTEVEFSMGTTGSRFRNENIRNAPSDAFRAFAWTELARPSSANLQLSGFFALVAERVVEHAHRPLVLLIAIVGVAGFFSAFFVNDTMCLVLTPLVLEITETLRRNPVPYLLAVAMASNIGSVATITGNPQNMMIGSFSGTSYRQYLACLAPVALAGLVLAVLVIYLAYRSEFASRQRVNVAQRPVRVDRWLMWKSIVASLAMIIMFFAGWPVPKVAYHAPRESGEELSPYRLEPAGDVVFAGVEKTSLQQVRENVVHTSAFSQRLWSRLGRSTGFGQYVFLYHTPRTPILKGCRR